mmetsp:Transcript_88893/g.229310  ORF Transcript_88893/g.229310 Transcript_88893/m.229310 type:complete len:624 (+) Transcript_88893:132-2003(+)
MKSRSEALMRVARRGARATPPIFSQPVPVALQHRSGCSKPWRSTAASSIPVCRRELASWHSVASLSAARGALVPAGRRCFSTRSPMQRYKDMCGAGEITHDPNQEQVIARLDELASKLNGYVPQRQSRAPAAATKGTANGAGGGFLSGLFGGANKKSAAPPKPAELPRILPIGPKGLYVWGGCGSGKTFLMDMFYNSVQVERKQRIHFHEWMISVHERLHRLQKSKAMVQEKANTEWTATAALAQQKQLKNASAKNESADDLVEQVANEMMSEGWLLCFDEFQVTHISDAIIMKRLFEVLFARGVVVVATSNRPTEDLYLNGLNRSLFLPFIPMLNDFCDVHNIPSRTDYRLVTEGEEKDRRVYISPNGEDEQKLLERKFYRICHGEVQTGCQVELQGRKVVVPKAAAMSNVAWFNFKDLCDKPLGAADYLAVAHAFHTVFISDIPKLTLQERDQVRRFITLIDAFYEKHTKMVCTAALNPIELFSVTEEDKKTSVADEIFAWDRTVSRLIEMQSIKYLSEQARALDGEQFLGQYNIQSLSDEDLQDMWRRYDADDSGHIDKDELRVLLEDLLEKQKGHRCLGDDVFQLSLETMDLDGSGDISFDEFEKYFKELSTTSSAMYQ